MTAEEKGFLSAIKANPKDATARGAFADWLDEHGRAHEAMLQRAAAGLSEVRYKIRRKSDGLFSEGAEGRYEGNEPWTTRGKMWPTIVHLRGHLNSQVQDHAHQRRWNRRLPAEFRYQNDTPLADLEVVVVELRFVVGARMAVSIAGGSKGKSKTAVSFTELGREGTPE